VSSQLDAASRPVLVAESFSALVAARWAANDPHVRALVLVAGFARSPTPWAAALGASMPAMAQFVGANFLNPMAFAMRDPTRQRWTQALSSAIAALDRGVVAERLRLIATEDVSRDLASLRIPVVLVQLDDDLVIGSVARDHLEAVCHNAHVIRVPGPHFAIETRPRESAEAIRAPLAALFAASRTTPAR
jgi:pimeloyl-ACP methyl ester carboxylesterase